MSWPTWTPGALSSELRPYHATVWRSVEAQHVVATMKLTDGLEEQRLLEELIEAHKPPVPVVARDLHFLLFTPFRYRPSRRGSRFRGPGERPGVFYAAEAVATALAERAFYKLLDMAQSIGPTPPSWSGQVTVFSVPLLTQSALDLTVPPLDADRAAWTQLTDYAPCQALAVDARAARADLVRFESVRDPAQGAAIALLQPTAFAAAEPTAYRTWHLHADFRGARLVEDFSREALDFPRTTFDADPRLAPLSAFG